MPLPLVHVVPTSRRCGATTLAHLWGRSADERPLESPVPASGSPWIVPVIGASPQYMDYGIHQLYGLLNNPRIRIWGVLVSPTAPGPVTADVEKAIENVRRAVAPAPVHFIEWNRSLSRDLLTKVPQWDFKRPKERMIGKRAWDDTYNKFSDIVDYIAAAESNPATATPEDI